MGMRIANACLQSECQNAVRKGGIHAMRDHSDLVSTALAAAALAAAILLGPWGARAHSDSTGPRGAGVAAADDPATRRSECTPGMASTQASCVTAGTIDGERSNGGTRTAALSDPF
jgi:hypothetical protein